MKTVGESHSKLQGFCTVERSFPDSVITDDFRIVEKYRSEEADGVCYDWYEIDCHNRMIDWFGPAKGKIETGMMNMQDIQEQNRADIAYIAMMADIEL